MNKFCYCFFTVYSQKNTLTHKSSMKKWYLVTSEYFNSPDEKITKCQKNRVKLHWLIVWTWDSENHKSLKKKLISWLKLTSSSCYWICLLNENIFRHEVCKYRVRRYSPHAMGRKSILTPLGLLLSLTGWLWWGREGEKTKTTYECLALVSPN